ncbi:hypothetical protein ACFLZP_01650 [Patescibacteria group bacterium]
MPIKIKVKEIELPRPVPEGLYQAVVKEVTEGEGEFGEYLKFAFEITEGEQKGVIKYSLASKKLSRSKSGKTSKLFGYVEALTKTKLQENEVLDVEEMVGKPCQIFVKNDKEVDGVMMQKIADLMPVSS